MKERTSQVISLLLFILGLLLIYTILLTVLKESLLSPVSIVISLAIVLVIGWIVAFKGPFKTKLEIVTYPARDEHVKLLSDAGQNLISMLDLDQLVQYLIHLVVKNIGANNVSLFLWEEIEKKYQMKASFGLGKKISEGYALDSKNGIVKWLQNTNEIFVKSKMKMAVPERLFKNVYRDVSKLSAEVCIPLLYKDKLAGVLNLGEKKSGDSYSDDELEILRALSSDASIALENARLYTEAVTDGLTRLYHHKYFQRRLIEEINRANRSKRPLSLILLDIDQFDDFNEKYGYDTGDELLRGISEIVKENVRIVDTPARYLGGEFAIILPETSEQDALNIAERLSRHIRGTIEVAERLRKRIAQYKIPFEDKDLSVTVSVGVTGFDGKDREMTSDLLVKRADEALFQAKKAGGNRVKVMYDQEISVRAGADALGWYEKDEGILKSGEIVIDLNQHVVKVNKKELSLTPKEFDLLCLLMKRRGRVLNRTFLTESIWGYEYFGTTRTVDVHIAQLRDKLGPVESKKIKTVEGLGYKFVDESVEASQS